MSDSQIFKDISAVFRVYTNPKEDRFPLENAFQNDFLSRKGKDGKYFNKIETNISLELPESKPIKSNYELQDPVLSEKYNGLFLQNSDVNSKIIYINRAIDHDLLNISRYRAAINYYESLLTSDYKYNDEIGEQKERLMQTSKMIQEYIEMQCQAPILFDTDIKKRIETDGWALDSRRNFIEFMSKTFNPLVSENLNSRGKSLAYNEATKSVEKISLFQHQQFISDFMQDNSPYRGVLLFYGLGSGKTLSSINIAEGMDRKVYIFLPKSIKNNFKEDMIAKGNTLYHTQNHWCFYNVNSLDGDISNLGDMGFPILDRYLLEKLYIKRESGENGFWLVDKGIMHNNFDLFPEEHQAEIAKTCETLRDYKYKFIHYNGGQSLFKTTLKQIWADVQYPNYDVIEDRLIHTKLGKPVNTKSAQLTKVEKNKIKNYIVEHIYNPENKIPTPFDNTLIIIDEVHNFMSQICNGSNNGTLLYEMFMRSKNCKIVALSGTPIINSPFEASILFNLLKGYTTYIDIPIKSTVESFNPKVLDEFLLRYPEIDRHDIDLISKKISITRMPNGFIKNPSKPNYVIKDARYLNISDDEFLEKFFRELLLIDYRPDSKYNIQHFSIFPDIFSDKPKNTRYKLNIEKARDTFYDLYVDRSASKVRNEEEFLYRIMGLVSFYNEIVSDELKVGLKDTHSLFPELFYDEHNPEYVDISMSQLFKYHDVRQVEREREQRDRKRSSKAELIFNIESKVSKTFKVTSRQALLFTFPAAIIRPRLKLQYCDVATPECKERVKDDNKKAEFEQEQALRQLFIDLDNPRYLTINDDPEALQHLSPKFAKMITNIFTSPGLVFIYSQFRSVEGVEIFALVLKNNGFEALDKLSPKKETHLFKEGDAVRVNPYEIYPDRWITTKVVSFDGDNVSLLNVESPVHRERCFRARYAIWSGTETEDERKIILREYKSQSNKYGQLLNILLTTASGSEGINLKYVRQVHIMEPYWNKVRVDQVIGRARRIESHKDLPEDQRNVVVYEYVSRFTNEQISGVWENKPEYSLLKNKKQITAGINGDGKTSDQELLEITIGKYKIIHQFLTLIKRGSVDCIFNRDDNIFSDPTFKTQKCLDRIIGEGNFSYDTRKLPTIHVEGVSEKKIESFLKHFNVSSEIFGSSFRILYETSTDIQNLLEIGDDDAIPIFNFYTYYGINPMSSQMKKSKVLIGSFRKDTETGQRIQLALIKSFQQQIHFFEKIDNIIKTIDEPDFSNETDVVVWINRIQTHPDYLKLSKMEDESHLTVEEAPKKKKIIMSS